MGCSLNKHLVKWCQPLMFDPSWAELDCFSTPIQFQHWFHENERKQYDMLNRDQPCTLTIWLQHWLKWQLQCYLNQRNQIKNTIRKCDPYQHQYFRTQITMALVRSLSYIDSADTLEKSIVATFPAYSRFKAREVIHLPSAMLTHSLRQLVLFWCALPQDQVFTWFDHLFDIINRKPQNHTENKWDEMDELIA